MIANALLGLVFFSSNSVCVIFFVVCSVGCLFGGMSQDYPTVIPSVKENTKEKPAFFSGLHLSIFLVCSITCLRDLFSSLRLAIPPTMIVPLPQVSVLIQQVH